MDKDGHLKDLTEIAQKSQEDFYELLGFTSSDFDETKIQRAYRIASVKVHPDKNKAADAAEKFILLGTAREILSNPTLRALYDAQRQRNRDKARQYEQMDQKRRKMAEDLERGEREASLKRKREQDPNFELDEREKLIKRIQEDNRKKMREFAEKRERERQEMEAKFKKPSPPPEIKRPTPGSTPDLARTIKVRFTRTGDTAEWDKDKVSSMFAKYGEVDIVIDPEEKKLKAPGAKRKRKATIFLTYTRLDHAYKAVADAMDDWPMLDSVKWADKAPEIGENADPAISSSELTMMRLKDAAKKQKEQKKAEGVTMAKE